MDKRLSELYGGQAPKPGSDQETREEYEARKSKNKKKEKKSSKSQPNEAQNRPKVLQTHLKVIDAEETPLFTGNRSLEASEPADGHNQPRGFVGEPEVSNERRRERFDSSSSSDEGEGNGGRRRRRVDTSSDEEDEDVGGRGKIDVDSDGDVVVSSTRTRRRRHSSSSSSMDESNHRGNAGVDVDSDGDVHIASKKRRTRSSSSSSSEEEEEVRGSTVGLKSKEEFAQIIAQRQNNSKSDETDEFALGKGQSTVYRDKKTGEVKQVKVKTPGEIAQENELLRFELNMGAMDKLELKGISGLGKQTGEEILEEDPMARFLKKANPEENLTLTGKPKYKGRAPAPNRFRILPGYRWDGVDRSNGFEARLLRKRNERLGA